MSPAFPRLTTAALLAVLTSAGLAGPAAAEPSTATVTGAVLPTRIHIGGPTVPLPVLVTLSEPRTYVAMILDTGGLGMKDSVQVEPADTRFEGELQPLESKLWPLGPATWELWPEGPAETWTTPASLRIHSLLGLRAARSGRWVQVHGSARLYNPNHDAYLAWPGRRIQIQRWTADGWRTIRTVTTDRHGNLDTSVRIPFTAGLRLHNPDAAKIWGATTDELVR